MCSKNTKKAPWINRGLIKEEAKMLTQNKSRYLKTKPLSSFNFNKHYLWAMSNIFLKKPDFSYSHVKNKIFFNDMFRLLPQKTYHI